MTSTRPRSLTEKLESNRKHIPVTSPTKKKKSNGDEKFSPYFKQHALDPGETEPENGKDSTGKKTKRRKQDSNKEDEEKVRGNDSTVSKEKIRLELKKFRNTSKTSNDDVSDDEDFEIPAKKTRKMSKESSKTKGGVKKRVEKLPSLAVKNKNVPRKQSKKVKNEKKLASSESDSEWEEVETKPSTSSDQKNHQKSDQPIEITVNAPKGKPKFDMEKMIQREINRIKREKREKLHKVHLLTYFAHEIRLSRACNDRLVQSLSLSLIPVGFCNLKPSEFDLDSLKRFVKWFKSAFILCYDFEADFSCDWEGCLIDKLERKIVNNYKELALVFVSMIRSMSINSRLVTSAHPISFKEEQISDKEKVSEKKNSKSTSKEVPKSSSSSKEKMKSSPKDVKNGKKIVDFWAEVFLEPLEKWICVNFINASVDDAISIEENCSQPISYVFACDSENSIRDVTPRYAANFASPNVRRLRLKDEWYEKTLKLFKTKSKIRDRLEDLELKAKLSELPMPKTINEFKNHPLYVLKRDLLKFQGIYPPETKPVGYIRNEPIYPRTALHMLHSKETWRKEARMVRSGEEPVKIVKARPKAHVPKEEQVDRPLPLFGLWQTDPYVSPPAVDGIVPRNEYGNVELFKPSMLPAGTVYLPHPGLLQVAKKLEIDCVPAMVGWDFHAGGSHPLLEGWVVCEEFKETLIAAWDQEQAINAEREIERKSKRALNNWKKFTKNLLLREKVRKKFMEKNPEMVQSSPSVDPDQLAESTSKSWPQCRMDFTLDRDKETL